MLTQPRTADTNTTDKEVHESHLEHLPVAGGHYADHSGSAV
jgi:hypothetical protein